MASKDNPEVRKNELVIQELKGEILIYDFQTDKAFHLNETSALIWNLSDGSKTVSEISIQLSRKFNKAVPEDLVWLALNDLKKANLLSNGETVTSEFDGLSRREVIRNVGLASLITLPIIASLVAPTAAMAQSGGAPLPENAPCSSPSQCDQFPGVGTQCCTATSGPVGPGNPLICRAGGAGFNCV